MEFLKANGIEDHSFVKEMDYQEVLNSQEIFGDELAMFAKKELQKEVSCKAGICREGKRGARFFCAGPPSMLDGSGENPNFLPHPLTRLFSPRIPVPELD